MSTPTGNRFWHSRCKHGRKKLFATPEALWEAACEYFDWCEDNPIIEITRHDDEKWERLKTRPFTVEGLCMYLGCNMGYLQTLTHRMRDKTDQESLDFMDTITRIRDVIYVQKYSGAVTGLFNVHMVVRELGLNLAQPEDKMTVNVIEPNNPYMEEKWAIEGNL